MSGAVPVTELVAVTQPELLPSFDRVNQSKSQKLCWRGTQGLGLITAGTGAARAWEPVVGTWPASPSDVVPINAERMTVKKIWLVFFTAKLLH